MSPRSNNARAYNSFRLDEIRGAREWKKKRGTRKRMRMRDGERKRDNKCPFFPRSASTNSILIIVIIRFVSSLLAMLPNSH